MSDQALTLLILFDHLILEKDPEKLIGFNTRVCKKLLLGVTFVFGLRKSD